MTDDSIKNLVERFSCDLVLADPKDQKSFSSLLPLLKTIHSRLISAGLEEIAGKIIGARNIINNIVQKSDSLDMEKSLARLEEIAAQVSGKVDGTEGKDMDQDSIDQTDLPDDSSNEVALLKEHLYHLSQCVAEFCPGEIPDLGAIIITLEEIVKVAERLDQPAIILVASACKNYVDHITLEEMDHIKPVEEGLILLKALLSHLKQNEEFVFDYSEVLESLGHTVEEKPDVYVTDTDKPDETDRYPQLGGRKITDDDLEILVDFVSESMDSLDSIEVSLIDLEQDPSNSDIINDIFRPFHTIKGVSGFLSLTKINTLAHATENLLDSARSGEFVIDQTATDAILESVDTLKILIDRISQGTQEGALLSDDDVDTSRLQETLRQLQISLSSGEKEPLGEILVKRKVVDREDLEDALELQKEQPSRKIGQILVEEKNVSSKQVASALMEQSSTKKKVDTQVKVSTRKLDDLVDYAGELVIAQSMLRQKTIHDASLSQNVVHLGQIVTNMQTIAMSMRMIPIKATFMKMIRLVRDLSKKSSKKVELQMIGEDTEIDRNVVDALYEPMVHMIRNSVDHGIELPDDREKNDKPAQGRIDLRAYHKGGHIIIEIEDDGNGLDRDSILEKAISTGLIKGDEQLTDGQVFDLIMQPGFSTAKQITDVSGRGVGMDVVKDGIEKFRGHLDISSQKGKGTRFTISLPLTLAIIDGMLVRVGEEKYVIPTIAIQKAFKPSQDEYFTVEGKGEMIKDRGRLVPLIRLDEIYGTGSSDRSIQDCLVVVVESKDDSRALLIDELLGKDEYVIKSLGGSMSDLQGIAGGAILADGRVGLILDVFGIFSIVSNR